jgi:glutamyl-tRNA synthetase/glutamyl-Q tRNA(Asp) synthetase
MMREPGEHTPMIRPDLTTARHIVATPIVTRFAPSPTGYLHLGHVVNAIYVWGLAQALNGAVIIRIEDHDRLRSRPAFDTALVEDLCWLGFLPHDGSPSIVRQQQRDDVYSRALEQLRQVAHVYACDCSRTTHRGELYPGRCRDRGLAEGPGCGLRVQLEPGIEQAEDLLRGTIRQAPADQCGDLLLKDRDGHWTYQFAATVDDFHQRVTLVIRGADLLSSTGRQVRLGTLLRRAECGDRDTCDRVDPPPWPPCYLHHPLLHDETGTKLSKSTGATGVRHLRATGVTPEEVIGRAAEAVGLLDAPAAVAARDVGALLKYFPRLD